MLANRAAALRDAPPSRCGPALNGMQVLRAMTRKLCRVVDDMVREHLFRPLQTQLQSLVTQTQSFVMQSIDALAGIAPEIGGPIAMAVTDSVTAAIGNLAPGELQCSLTTRAISHPCIWCSPPPSELYTTVEYAVSGTCVAFATLTALSDFFSGTVYSAVSEFLLETVPDWIDQAIKWMSEQVGDVLSGIAAAITRQRWGPRTTPPIAQGGPIA